MCYNISSIHISTREMMVSICTRACLERLQEASRNQMRIGLEKRGMISAQSLDQSSLSIGKELID